MSLRFHLFVSGVNQGNKDFGYKKVGSRFSCLVPEMERFSLDLLQTVKKECTQKWGGKRGVGCVEFVVAAWCKVKNF